MAVILFNRNNEPTYAAKEENDLNLHRGDIAEIKSNGRLKTISEAEFHSFISNEKTARLDGENVVFEDPIVSDIDPVISLSSDDFDMLKNLHLEAVKNLLESKGGRLNESAFSNLKTRLNAYKTGLENLDKSTYTLPSTTSFIRLIIDNEDFEVFHGAFIGC
tara:strand:- start:169 stop:654 length:486 start_codon:yes stop_codon:yes gene_type:complete